MFRKQLLKHSLAATAVAAAVVLTTPAAFADEPACGTPGSEAVFETVTVDPTYRTVPAVTHDAWRWQRDVVGTAVIEDEYVHQVTGKTRWERADWGAQNGQGKGWDKTGATRETATVEHQESDEPSAEAPEGEGWTAIESSRVTIEDAAAYDELVTPGSSDQVLVSPAVPAGEPCQEIAIISDGGPRVGGDSDDSGDAGSSDVVEGPVAPGNSAAAGPQAAAAPTTAAATTLPNTGGVAGWMAPLGVGAVLAGGALAAVGRRRSA